MQVREARQVGSAGNVTQSGTVAAGYYPRTVYVAHRWRPRAGGSGLLATIAVGLILFGAGAVGPAALVSAPSSLLDSVLWAAAELRQSEAPALAESRQRDERSPRSPATHPTSGSAAGGERDVADARRDDWPSGREGYTVQVAAKPTLAAAEDVARRATGGGLRAGVFHASEHPGTTSDGYVVYQGIFDSLNAAMAQLRKAREIDPSAVVQWVSPSGREAPGIGGGGGAAGTTHAAVRPPSAPTYVAKEARAFSVEVPAGWTLVEDDVTHGPFNRTEWRNLSDPDVYVFVDEAPRHGIAPQAAAELAYAGRSGREGYADVFFGATQANGRDAWKWIYRLGEEQLAHYFVQACGTAYAVRGSASRQAFESYAPIFSHVAETLAPRC
jgi:hypothetical protein